MGNLVELFCKQNPVIEIKCPKCNKILKLKSKNLFAYKNTYKYKCTYCNNTVTLDTEDFYKKMKL